MGKLMILGAGIMQTPLIKKAKELGHYIITVDRDKNAEGNNYSDLVIQLDTNDIPGILESARLNQINGILTSSDLPVRVVAAVCEELKLPGLKKEAANICTNKFLMREHLKTNGFLVPRYMQIKSEDDLNDVDFFPSIIKPLDSSGSRGVKRNDTVEELLEAFPFSKSFSKCNSVLVEEIIDGPEFSVETFSQGGQTHIVSITEKWIKGSNKKFFVEDRHIVPAKINKKQAMEIQKTIINFIQSLDLGDSATHTEVKLNKQGIYIIESGARLGGDFIASDLVPLATGVDMLENAINIALGKQINTKPKKMDFTGIQFINSENYQLISSFIQKNQEKLFRFQIDPFFENALQSSFDRLGYFIAVAKTRKGLLAILDCIN